MTTTQHPESKGFTEAQMHDLMKQYIELRDQANEYAGFQKGVGNTIREYIRKHGGALHDFERGNSAMLQEREGAPEIDAIALAAKEPGIILELAKMGCLKLDYQTFKQFNGKAGFYDAAKRFLMPGKPTTALVVEHKPKQ